MRKRKNNVSGGEEKWQWVTAGGFYRDEMQESKKQTKEDMKTKEEREGVKK